VAVADPAYSRGMMAKTGLRAGDIPNLKSNAMIAAIIRGMMRGEGTRNPHDGPGKQSNVIVSGGIHVTSSNADPKAVADQTSEAMRRYLKEFDANLMVVPPNNPAGPTRISRSRQMKGKAFRQIVNIADRQTRTRVRYVRERTSLQDGRHHLDPRGLIGRATGKPTPIEKAHVHCLYGKV
jgi:hypothetical protein